MIRLKMIIQYNINKVVAKISALSSNKIDKYKNLTGEEILPSNRKQIIEQAKITYSVLGKLFEKQIKITEDQGKKQDEAFKDLKPEEQIKLVKGIFPKGYKNVEIKKRNKYNQKI